MESNNSLKETVIQETEKNDDNYFPFEPYSPQKEFMTSFLNALTTNKKIGLFESPTGTGKTLMLLCTAMTYLSNAIKEKEKVHSYSNTTPTTDNAEDDWLNAFGKSPQRPLMDLHAEIENYRHINHLKSKLKQASIIKKKKVDKMLINNPIKPSLNLTNNTNTNTNINLNKPKTQILFCTRTHSQIAQVIKEAKRIRNDYQSTHKAFFPFSFSILGSRKQLCINPLLTKLNTASSPTSTALNAKCKEMIEESKCLYFNTEAIDLLSKDINNTIMDIEDLESLSKQICACPYFACRNSIEASDFILLPYNSILNKTVRTNLNISLKGSIIIFDEAHNIIESMLQSYTSEISLETMLSVHIGLILYYNKYSSRLKAENNLMIRQLITISERIIEFIINIGKSDNSSGSGSGNSIQLTEFAIKTNTTNYDLFKLIKFIEDAELKQKLQWTIEQFISSKKTIEDLNEIIKSNGHLKSINQSQLNIIIQSPQCLLKEIISKDAMNRFTLFINGLTYINEDGIIIINYSGNSKYPQLKFQMINPIREFEGIISEAKCIIFAGGTMKPFDDFKPLFTSILGQSQSDNLIATYEGDHVITSNALLVNIIQSNPFNSSSIARNEPIQFTYDQFKQKESMLLQIILKTIEAYLNQLHSSSFEGKGIAVFVPSYDLLSKLIEFNAKAHLIPINCLYYEKSNSNEQTFELYKDSLIKPKQNSVIIAVIGGKLSEGINFNDDLARVVLLIGLPYPNIHSTEIKEKMRYYDRLVKQKVLSTNGNEYYENICIKAVNQSIGRAIRHSNDYAAIVLVDWRYTKENIINKLPKWLRKKEIGRICNKEQFDDSLSQLSIFLNKERDG